MKNYLKILFTIIALVLVIILVNLFGPDYNEIKNQAYKSLQFDVYRGIVVEKYLDRDNHNYPSIRIMNEQGIQTVRLQLDKSGLYEFIEKNDSIVKEYGSYEVKVYRNNKTKTFTLDYGDDF